MKMLWLTLAVFYLATRFGFTAELDAFGPYTSYTLELILVGIGLGLSRKTIIQDLKLHRYCTYFFIPALIAGSAAYIGAEKVAAPIPFNLQGFETLFFLLLVAPILEELVFQERTML